MQPIKTMSKDERDLAELLELIRSDAIERIDDLSERQVELLRALLVEGEDIDTLLDRLRGSDRDSG